MLGGLAAPRQEHGMDAMDVLTARVTFFSLWFARSKLRLAER